ncbi:Hypothetical predicted protein [Marmota monax]|uniref:Rab-GAP TBC domain-containing protein n=1 Tax=Marmota monax TaxID=9995 RepID=A0A5E4AP60_MARMO|nr:Hypothetical predicted protein [Marmota monax]
MSSLHKSRIADFQDVLKEPSIALEKLRELSFSGIPCEGGLRCLCWKILLNYLPLERAAWTSILAKQRELYSQFLREMIIQPGIAKANMGVSREDVTFEDHPLNPSPDSRWNTYFKDNERATEYPCLLILDPQNEFETLRKRVEQTTLKSQTVARNRSGVTNHVRPAHDVVVRGVVVRGRIDWGGRRRGVYSRGVFLRHGGRDLLMLHDGLPTLRGNDRGIFSLVPFGPVTRSRPTLRYRGEPGGLVPLRISNPTTGPYSLVKPELSWREGCVDECGTQRGSRTTPSVEEDKVVGVPALGPVEVVLGPTKRGPSVSGPFCPPFPTSKDSRDRGPLQTELRPPTFTDNDDDDPLSPGVRTLRPEAGPPRPGTRSLTTGCRTLSTSSGPGLSSSDRPTLPPPQLLSRDPRSVSRDSITPDSLNLS